MLQSKCALSTAECGIFKIISSYFFIFLLSVSLALSLSLCLSVLELMAEFKMLIQSLNIRVSSLSPPPCQRLCLIHCSDEHLIYIITAAQASFLSHKYTYTSTRTDSNLLCVTLQAWDSGRKHNQHTYTPPHDRGLRPHLTLLHLSVTPLSLLFHPSPPPLLFLFKTIFHSIMIPMLLCWSLSFSLVCCFGKIAHLYYHKSCKISKIKHTNKKYKI